MEHTSSEVTIGYLGAHLETYYAEEYNLFDESIQGLSELGDEFGFTLVSSDNPIVSAKQAEAEVEKMISQGVDFLILHHATFLMGDIVRSVAKYNIPLGLWTHPEPTTEGAILLNGFVSIDMSASIIKRYLKDDAIKYKWFYGSTKHSWLRDRLRITVSALRGKKSLKNGTVALVGGIAPTFYNFTFDERRISDSIGLKINHHELKEILDRVKNIDPSRIKEITMAIAEKTNHRISVSQTDLNMTASIYAALKDFSEHHGYTALAVSDWPVFQQELNIHPGFAFSWLEDQEKIPVASEGDVMGAATMILMNSISQKETYLLDMAAIDTEQKAMLMWHCGGSPLTLADGSGVQCINHSTLGRKIPNGRVTGAVADLVFREGPVTVSRLSDDGKVLFSFDAKVQKNLSKGYEGCRGWISNFTVRGNILSLGDLVNTVFDEGLEHHFGLVEDQWSDAIEEWSYWVGSRSIAPSAYTNGRGPTANL
tara:strand:+ start:3195 stop:4640 length:1446 start_codon:yes stop_codon:yes gene_type:complete